MIPVIDLGPYLAARPHAAAATTAALGRALQDVGFFFGTVLRLPPEQLARLHILPQSQIDAWLAAGHFHTVTIGTADPRVQALGLLRRYSRQEQLHHLYILSDPVTEPDRSGLRR
jgi:hypothetical protein